MFHPLPLLAQDASRIVFEWGRIESNADWILPVTLAVALIFFTEFILRVDTRESGRMIRILLTQLRVAAILCVVAIYLEPRWRSEREVVRNSRVVLLVDTSSSMGQIDAAAPPSAAGLNRLEQVTKSLESTEFLKRLRRKHDVVLTRFDEKVDQVVCLEKLPAEPPEAGAPPNPASPGAKPSQDMPADKHRPDENASAGVGWQGAFLAKGNQTRLGQALQETIREERNGPVSGIVVFTDGGQNAGVLPEVALEAARAAKLPIFTVGLGSTRKPANARIKKLEVPPQAHPGDPYSVSGVIQSHGMAGKSARVELLLRDAEEGASGNGTPGTGTLFKSEEVILGDDDDPVPVKFEITPETTGRRVVCLQIRAPAGDGNRADDFLEDEIDVIDRKLRILLFASGPTREYRFLRTLLFRDSSTTLDVLLDTARPGISQEADAILDEFPIDREEINKYDCVVGFDPNWQSLAAAQVDLLEDWVGEQGGGLIVMAGPVCAGESIGGWIGNPEMAKIRALYPVEFSRRISVFESASSDAREPWPLDFTREGLEAEFLRLGESAIESQRNWATFSGVYRCFPVHGPKPGATVLARFSDPRAAPGGDPPVFFAEQFYGSGRVFYLGSGEMWRLRQIDEALFEQFYTRLIRHVSSGRLLRQSSRGALLVGQDRYVLGNTVEIRARMTNARFEPWEASSLSLEVIRPDGSVDSIALRPEPSRPGTYVGQLTVLAEGTYRLELPVPEDGDERIIRRIKVKLPDLECENPERDGKLLTQIAEATQGRYYPKLSTAMDVEAADPLVEQLSDRTKTIIQTGAIQPPSIGWILERWIPQGSWPGPWVAWLKHQTWVAKLLEQTLTFWLMSFLCGLLCCEWLVRRLVRLA